MSMPANIDIPFGCYYIDRDYLEYLHEHGDEHVPKADYEDEGRARKFYCGPVFNEYGVNYFVPVSHELDKNDMSVYDPETRTVEYYGMYIRDTDNNKIGNLDFRFMIPCQDNELLTPCTLSGHGAKQANACLAMRTHICKAAQSTYNNIETGDYPWLNANAIDYNNVNDAMWSYDDEKMTRRELIANQLASNIKTDNNDFTPSL